MNKVLIFPATEMDPVYRGLRKRVKELSENIDWSCTDQEEELFNHIKIGDYPLVGFNLGQEEQLNLTEQEKISSFLPLLEKLNDHFPIFPPKIFLISPSSFQRETVMAFSEFNISSILNYPFQKEKLTGKWNQLIKEFSQLSEEEKRYEKIEEHRQKEELKEAEMISEELIHCFAKTARAFYVKATILELKEDLEQAEKVLKEGLDINPNHLPTLKSLAKILLKQDRLLDAYSILDKANSLNPFCIARNLQLGQTCLSLTKLNKAESYFSKTLELDSDMTEAQVGLGKVCFAKGDLLKAREMFELTGQAMELARYYNNQGVELIGKKEYLEAINLYRNAQYVLPEGAKSALLFFNLALSYEKWGKLEHAYEYAKLALIKDPKYDKARRMQERIVKRQQTLKMKQKGNAN